MKGDISMLEAITSLVTTFAHNHAGEVETDLVMTLEPFMMAGAAATAVLVAGLVLYFKGLRWIFNLIRALWTQWFTSLDAKKIGVMYMVLSVLMLLRGGLDAVMMRVQQALAVDGAAGILTSDHFQQISTAHGTIMIFFVAMGLLFGLMNLVVPMMIGARDVAYPFLNSVSFWLFAVGVVLVNLFLVVGEFSAAGWVGYPPLSGLEYSPGVGVDYWIWALQISGIGSLLSGINFIVTILKKRAPSMRLMQMPMFVWSVLGAMVLVVFAFPILTATLGMLSLDRLIGSHFFTSDFGGNPMMYINLIWAWGHPEVYILILPAFGIFSEIVATFSRKRLFGYKSMVAAIWAIVFLSFTVWLHHFFTMGAGANVNAFFGIMTAVIAVPTGVKIFNWLATMYRGRIKLATPMLWFIGFVVVFTIGGAAGVLMSIPAVDFQVHNSLFLVAHFHSMVVGGVLFGFFAGIIYWFPKFTGFKLHEGIGKVSFWCWLIGFLLAFVPLYILGLMGATRRLDGYDASLGWQGLFIVAGVGVVVIGLGLALMGLQILWSFIQRKKLADTTGDPWDGRTLEWATTSPPMHYSFAITPHADKRDAFWEAKRAGVSVAEGKPYTDIEMPKNTPIGMFIAAASFFVGFGLIWHQWWLALLGFVAIIVLIIVRSMDEHTEYVLSADELQQLEANEARRSMA